MSSYEVSMDRRVYFEILSSVGSTEPETGGLLLGPTDAEHVSKFWFDESASCTRTSYSPDVATMNALLRDVWRPQGLDWKGIVHSHPQEFANLSTGDLHYIRRLLRQNKDIPAFIAPLVLPESFTFRMLVVPREQPGIAIPARLILT